MLCLHLKLVKEHVCHCTYGVVSGLMVGHKLYVYIFTSIENSPSGAYMQPCHNSYRLSILTYATFVSTLIWQLSRALTHLFIQTLKKKKKKITQNPQLNLTNCLKGHEKLKG